MGLVQECSAGRPSGNAAERSRGTRTPFFFSLEGPSGPVGPFSHGHGHVQLPQKRAHTRGPLYEGQLHTQTGAQDAQWCLFFCSTHWHCGIAVHHCAPLCTTVCPPRSVLPGDAHRIAGAARCSLNDQYRIGKKYCQWPVASRLAPGTFVCFFLLNLPLVLLPLVLLPLSVVPLGALRLCDLHCLSYRSVGETYRCSLLGPCISHCCCCCMEVALCAVV